MRHLPSHPNSGERRVDILTAIEVAEILRVPVMTVYRLAERGELPCLRIGGFVRFERTAIEHYLAERRQTPKAAPRRETS